mmetsp:Transcript_78954/g.229298  ORF Transcript_78954/g.229298 Transcript_78954/m.229298 type:complete len:281 (-) Transcript_78954:896-1738(-)
MATATWRMRRRRRRLRSRSLLTAMPRWPPRAADGSMSVRAAMPASVGALARVGAAGGARSAERRRRASAGVSARNLWTRNRAANRRRRRRIPGSLPVSGSSCRACTDGGTRRSWTRLATCCGSTGARRLRCTGASASSMASVQCPFRRPGAGRAWSAGLEGPVAAAALAAWTSQSDGVGGGTPAALRWLTADATFGGDSSSACTAATDRWTTPRAGGEVAAGRARGHSDPCKRARTSPGTTLGSGRRMFRRHRREVQDPFAARRACLRPRSSAIRQPRAP